LRRRIDMISGEVILKLFKDVEKLEQKASRYEIVLWLIADPTVDEAVKTRLAQKVLAGVEK